MIIPTMPKILAPVFMTVREVSSMTQEHRWALYAVYDGVRYRWCETYGHRDTHMVSEYSIIMFDQQEALYGSSWERLGEWCVVM